VKYRELVKKLKRLGCEYARPGAGSHEIWVNPHTRMAAPIPYHRSKDIGPKLLAQILKQLGVSRRDFDQA
jgi:predicted RNA binding protein YcfA (HicA-like mRNA interferase family)